MPTRKKHRARGTQPGSDASKKDGKKTRRPRRRLSPAEQKAIYDEIARAPFLENASAAYRRRAEVIVDLWFNALWIHPDSLVRRK